MTEGFGSHRAEGRPRQIGRSGSLSGDPVGSAVIARSMTSSSIPLEMTNIGRSTHRVLLRRVGCRFGCFDAPVRLYDKAFANLSGKGEYSNSDGCRPVE
jgi:hypothetical protein